MLTRRDFIKFMSLMGGVVLNPFQRLGNWLGVETAVGAEEAVGELYAGFVLLPDGADFPPFIQLPKLPLLDMEGNHVHAEYKQFNTAEDLANYVGFPIYDTDHFQESLRLTTSTAIGHSQSGVYEASLGFEFFDPTINEWRNGVSIHALKDYFHPYPLWSHPPATFGEPEVILEKVDFLPTPGIYVDTAYGFVCHWMERDILYTLYSEPSPVGRDAKQLLSWLRKVEAT